MIKTLIVLLLLTGCYYGSDYTTRIEAPYVGSDAWVWEQNVRENHRQEMLREIRRSKR